MKLRLFPVKSTPKIFNISTQPTLVLLEISFGAFIRNKKLSSFGKL